MLQTVFLNKSIYNQRINTAQDKIFAAMSAAQLNKDMGLFFSSIIGTLNHIMVGDALWLARVVGQDNFTDACGLPIPSRLDETLFTDYAKLRGPRKILDNYLFEQVSTFTDEQYAQTRTFHSMQGKARSLPLHTMLDHLFNHQTHHRGQVTTALHQLNIDFGSTDLIAYI